MSIPHFRTTAATLALLAAGAAQAQGEEPWRFQAAMYGWVPAISGTAVVGGHSDSLGISMGDVLDNLKMTFQGTFEVSRGRFGFFTDIFYGDLGHAKTGTRDITVGRPPVPVKVDGTLDLDVKNYIWTLAGTYNLVSSDDSKVDLLAGARMFKQDLTLNYDLTADIVGPGGVIPKQGSGNSKFTNWDAIVGVKGNFNLGAERRIVVPYYFDIGAGESDLTFQAFTGIGWRFDWGTAVVGWRYMEYRFKSGESLEDIKYNGPLVGVAIRF
jgi:hypothetical protein